MQVRFLPAVLFMKNKPIKIQLNQPKTRLPTVKGTIKFKNKKKLAKSDKVGRKDKYKKELD
jgi:hypothetical protein